MRVRVPSQRRTKWLFLAAALAASVLTWCQVRGAPSRMEPARGAREDAARGDLVEVEIEVGP